MTRWIRFVIRHRVWVLLGCLALSVAAVSLLPRLEMEADLVNTFSKDEPEFAFFRETGRVFGGNNVAMVVLQGDDVLDYDSLERVRLLTRAYGQVEGVPHVISLANTMDMRKTEFGLEVRDLLPGGKVPKDPAALAKLRDYVLSKEMYTSSMVAKDGKTTNILVRISEDAVPVEVIQRLRDATDTIPGEDRVLFAGHPAVMHHIFGMVLSDLTSLTILVGAVILIVLFLGFRNVRGVLLPLLTVALATLWSFGFMSAIGSQLTVISTVIPVLIFSVGTAYTIHLLNAVQQEYRVSTEPTAAIRGAAGKVGRAILLAGLTTVAGFLSLTSSPLGLFVDLALYCALGTAAALLISLTLIPALLSFLKPEKGSQEDRTILPGVERLLGVLAGGFYERKVAIVVGVILVVAASALGISRVRAEFDVLGFFPSDSSAVIAEQVMREEFGGSTPISVHVRGDLKNPTVLGEMLRFEKHMRVIPHVAQPQSIADLIAEMNRTLNDQRMIPPTREGIASLWLLMEGREVLDQLVNRDETRAMIHGRLDDNSGLVRAEAEQTIRRLITEKLRPELVELKWAGLPKSGEARLSAIATGEISELVRLDLTHEGIEIAEPEDLEGALAARVGRLPPPLPLNSRQKLVETYLAGEDCDLVLEEDGQTATLLPVLTRVEGLAVDDYAQALARAAPALAAEDPEGVQLAAHTLSKLHWEQAVKAGVRELLQVVGAVTAQQGSLPEQLENDLSGDLSLAFRLAWPITPTDYQAIAGVSPPADDIVRLTPRVTGMPVVLNVFDRKLVDSLALSIAAALGAVFILLLLQLRSLVSGFFAAVPVMLTLVVNYGVMGFVGIGVDPATMMIAAVAIGIGIDYSIHVAARLRAELGRSDTEREALANTLRTTGKAVVLNASAVGCGLLVLCASELVIIRYFGILIALCMALSAAGAITVFPALVLMTRAESAKRDSRRDDAAPETNAA